MVLMRYAKPSLSIADQSALILERGLFCDDAARLLAAFLRS